MAARVVQACEELGSAGKSIAAAMSVVPQVRAANQAYASTFANGGLAAPPVRRFAVVTCMDARLDPARFLGLEPGDANVIRNAGGLVTDDALRSLIISHWHLGTQEVVVVAHEGCGMLAFSNHDFRRTLQEQTGHDAATSTSCPSTIWSEPCARACSEFGSARSCRTRTG